MFDDQIEPQLVTKLLLQVSVREPHNSLVSYPNDGGRKMLGMKMVILLSVIQHYVHFCHLNLKKCLHVTILCVVVNVAFLLKVYIHHFYPSVIGI